MDVKAGLAGGAAHAAGATGAVGSAGSAGSAASMSGTSGTSGDASDASGGAAVGAAAGTATGTASGTVASTADGVGGAGGAGGANGAGGAGGDSAVADAMTHIHIIDPELAMLEECIYSDADTGFDELLRQAGLPVDDLHMEIIRALAEMNIALQRDIIENVATAAKKIDFIANNLSQEAAREAANELVKVKLAAAGRYGATESTRKNIANTLAKTFQQLSGGAATAEKATDSTIEEDVANAPNSTEAVKYVVSPEEAAKPAAAAVEKAVASDSTEAVMKEAELDSATYIDVSEWDIDLDILYSVISKTKSNAGSAILDIPEGYVRPESISDDAVRAAAEYITSGADHRERAALRMMLALDIPISKRNLNTVLAYHDKVDRLREVTPDAAAAAIKNDRAPKPVDVLLAAAAYTSNNKYKNIDEKTLTGLEGQIRSLLEKNGIAQGDGNINIAKALLRVGGGVSAENIEIIDKLLSDIESVLNGNSEEFAALLLKKGIDPGGATVELLGDLQKLLARMEKMQEAEARAVVRGFRPDSYSEGYLKQSVEAAPAEKISDTQLRRLESRIVELLLDNGMEPTEERVDAAKALVREGMEVNADNMERFFAKTERLVSMGAVFESISRVNERGARLELHEVDALIENLRESGKLILESNSGSDPRLDRIEKLIEMIGQLRVRDFSAIAALMKYDMPVTLKNLASAYASQDKRIDVALDATVDVALDATVDVAMVMLAEDATVLAKNAAPLAQQQVQQVQEVMKAHEAQQVQEAPPAQAQEVSQQEAPQVQVQQAQIASQVQVQQAQETPQVQVQQAEVAPQVQVQVQAQVQQTQEAPQVQVQVQAQEVPQQQLAQEAQEVLLQQQQVQQAHDTPPPPQQQQTQQVQQELETSPPPQQQQQVQQDVPPTHTQAQTQTQTQDTPPQEQAVNALIEQGVPVTRLTVINMYLANAAVKKVALTAGNENLITASAYLYDRGVPIENTSMLTLSSLLDTAIDAVGKSRIGASYRNAMQFRRDSGQRVQNIYIDSERKSPPGAANKTGRGAAVNEKPANGAPRHAGAGDRQNEGINRLNTHIGEIQRGRRSDAMRELRGGASGAADADTSGAARGGSGANIPGGARGAVNGAAHTAATSAALNELSNDKDNVADVRPFSQTASSGGAGRARNGADGSADGVTGADRNAGSQRHDMTGESLLNGLLSRILTS
ncbi:MAG: hypothetical protein FWH01_13300, partial [Oscillospiraceae bacterium]|nr:hypothetical protein [Oscillospiraceae bacterium]